MTDKTKELSFDPTRCKCIRRDGEEMVFPFVRKGGKTKLDLTGRGNWTPLVMTMRGEFVCGPFSFKRIYYPEGRAQ